MWKEPRIEDIKAPPDILAVIRKSVYFNREGALDGADLWTVIQYFLAVLFSSVMLGFLLTSVFQLIGLNLGNLGITIVISVVILSSLTLFYFWGWRNYSEAWYFFDDQDKLLTVILPPPQWELIEVPYETVHEVSWSGGHNGYATIHAGGMSFYTNRSLEERHSSVTELWPKLARFDTYMSDWPIVLICPECDREFGHHLGTAQCPFDEVILIDPKSKGRIDPEELHPDDYTRV